MYRDSLICCWNMLTSGVIQSNHEVGDKPLQDGRWAKGGCWDETTHAEV